jgi:hypothetical protein
MDLSSVQQIELEFLRLSPSPVPVVKSFTTVPEPSVVGVIGAGVLVMLVWIRRRRCVWLQLAG